MPIDPHWPLFIAAFLGTFLGALIGSVIGSLIAYRLDRRRRQLERR